MRRPASASSPSRAFLGALVAAVTGTAIVLAACGADAPDRPAGGGGGAAGTSGNGASDATRRALVGSAAICLADDYRTFATEAAALTTATAAYAESRDATTRDAARGAFRAAMNTWQLIEAIPIGPLASLEMPGGQDLREHIHAWPLVNRCGVEQLLITKAYETPGAVSAALVNTRGLANIEYLLFHEGTDNECGAATSLNAQGTWAALDPAELTSRKARFARALAEDVQKQADLLAAAWSSTGGDFARQLTDAGAGSTVYTSLPKAVNALSDALFYLEVQVKDRKLARPIGLLECEASSCPEKLESRYEDRDLQHIRQNVIAFRRIFRGCDAAGGSVGFEDVLRSLGANDLADRMVAAIEAALATLDAFPAPTLRASLNGQRDAALALHASIKAITDLLKTELVSVLDLELPKRVEGDND